MNATQTIFRANQIWFFEWIIEDAAQCGNPTNFSDPASCYFTRSYLRAIAFKHGMAWAPAWIVKDKSRVTTRGVYHLPELAQYLQSRKAPTLNDATPTVAGAD